MGKTKVVLQKSPLNTRSFQGRTGGMKAASSVNWVGAVPLPVMPHSLLWGALLQFFAYWFTRQVIFAAKLMDTLSKW